MVTQDTVISPFSDIFLGSALPLYTAMWVSTDYTKVNATSSEDRLAPGSCTCVMCTHWLLPRCGDFLFPADWNNLSFLHFLIMG